MFKQIFELFKANSLYEQALTECHEMLAMVKEIIGEPIKIEFSNDINENDHYELSPYRYTPKPAKKIVGMFSCMYNYRIP